MIENQEELAELEVLAFMGHDLYRKVHVELARKIGILEAYLVEDLVEQYKYFKKHHQLIEIHEFGNCFYYDHKKCDERLAIGEKTMLRLVKSLVDQGLIEFKVIGIPGKRHFKINFYLLSDIAKDLYRTPKRQPLSSEAKTHSSQTATMGGSNGNCIKDKNSNKSSKELLLQEEASPQEVVFPCLDQLKLSASKKKQLSKKYPEEVLIDAVNKALAWKGKKSHEAAIETILSKGRDWNDIPDKDKIIKDNQAYLEKFEHYDGKKLGKYKCLVSYKSIEFIPEGMGSIPKVFDVKQLDFIDQVNEFIKQNKPR